ncbi:DNA polymerase delta subunit 3 [Podarcis lilfordi]|uniref:DNA polymerase delta subunit 3 n=1 Tax=Podarcis lilfordi TaxID=74358 RepID=A0AA35K882_9SAUR|nr:DNA polymerase delta subunit 3 [Podarcis lilfordi]
MAAFVNLNFFLLVLFLAIAAAVCLDVRTGEWGCGNFRGYCRKDCFPQEKSLGPEDCAEGLVCCISGMLG